LVSGKKRRTIFNRRKARARKRSKKTLGGGKGGEVVEPQYRAGTVLGWGKEREKGGKTQ